MRTAAFLPPFSVSAKPAMAAAISDGGTIFLLAIGISQSSSTECSIWICARRFAAWRSLCAMSGLSLRRNEPMTSTRSSFWISVIGMPSHGAP